MPAPPEGCARPHPSEILRVSSSATRQQVEEAYLACLARLRNAFLDLGGFETQAAARHHTLDTFIASEANQVMLSACRRVCENPGRVFNPLYLYGRPGVGKSHLLAAIHGALAERHPGLLVVSTSAERFTEELLAAMGNHALEQFHDKYRGVDVLLVDNFHVLGNRFRTQEELSAVVDHLTVGERHIVVASQAPPRDCAGLLDSLRSRLSSGLVVEIACPDLETRKAIVRLLAEQAGLGLSREDVFTLAHRIPHDVRELKGAVTRILAHRGVAGAEPSLDELLYDLAPACRNERCTLEEVLEHISAWYAIEPHELVARPGTRNVKKARQVAMYLARLLTNATLQNVADALGATPSQVLYAVRTVKLNLDDPMLSVDLEGLHARLKRSSNGSCDGR